MAYFLYLFLLPGEPRVRRSTWAGKWYSQVWVQNTKEEPEWWTTSISEYAAARGSTGSKLLGSAMSVCGALQVVEGSLLGALCVASDVAKVFLWVGGIGTCMQRGSTRHSPHTQRGRPVMVTTTYVSLICFAGVMCRRDRSGTDGGI